MAGDSSCSTPSLEPGVKEIKELSLRATVAVHLPAAPPLDSKGRVHPKLLAERQAQLLRMGAKTESEQAIVESLHVRTCHATPQPVRITVGKCALVSIQSAARASATLVNSHLTLSFWLVLKPESALQWALCIVASSPDQPSHKYSCASVAIVTLAPRPDRCSHFERVDPLRSRLDHVRVAIANAS